MLGTQPIKTYRGTLAEVLRYEGEISPGAVVELSVFEPKAETGEDMGDFGGKSIGDLVREVGFIEGNGPSDMAAHPENYMQGFGENP
jgi:hypothetical protein